MSNVKKGAAVAAGALAVACIVYWEGMDPVAKQQAIDPPGVITVCNGITNFDRPKLKAGDRFTPEQCKQMLLEALPKYSAHVDRCIKVDMPPHRRAAMISFTYNVGGAAFCKSSVVRNLNAGRVQAGCDALLLYNRANGKVLRGLQNRREYERRWCLRDD